MTISYLILRQPVIPSVCLSCRGPSGYLEANPDAAANLGPLVGLEKQQHQYSDAVKALSDAALTRLVLVARAQASTLKEVSHTHDELSAIGLQHQHLAINGVLPPFAGENDPLAQSILAREEKALQAMPENTANLPRSQLYLKPFNLVGLEALRQLFTENKASLPLLLPRWILWIYRNLPLW